MAKKCWPLPCPQCLQSKGMLQQLWLQDEDPWTELQSENPGHPSCVGQRERNTRRLGKDHIFLPQQTRTNHGHSCFLLRAQRGQSHIGGCSPCVQGIPTGERSLCSQGCSQHQDFFVFHNAGNI